MPNIPKMPFPLFAIPFLFCIQNIPPKMHHEKRKTIWDQFCDFTSLVGFRLLHSKHPIWLRLLSIGLMVISTLMIFLQTRYFWNKFVDSKGQRIATVKETEGQDGLPQPRFLVCLTLQTASLMRGFGSVDFRELVYRYQIEGKRQNAVIQQLKSEISQLDLFFAKNFDENGTLWVEGIGLSRELKLLREIGAALSFDDAQKFEFNSKEFKQKQPNLREERGEYRERRNKLLSKCLPGFLRDRDQQGQSAALASFVQCRLNLARRLFGQFKAQQDDYFAYAQLVWMHPGDLIVRSHFFEDGPGHWERSWQVENGLCALGAPMKRTKIGIDAISADKNVDYILVKANRLEAHPSAKITVHLVYENELTGQLLRANSYELIAGKNLEVTIRGISEIQEDECTNEFPQNCVEEKLGYSSAICKWCTPEVRAACQCANPDLYLPEFVGTKWMRNCTLIEAMECGPRQTELFSKAECPNPCISMEYTSNYAAYDLTLEMLNMSILEAEHKYVPEQLLLIDKLNEFKRPRALNAKGKDTKIWKASAQLDGFLGDYYQVMIGVYRILYGRSFSLPIIFAEDAAALLGEVPPSIEFRPLEYLTKLEEEKLEICGETGPKNGLKRRLMDLGKAFLVDNFRKLSIHEWYPCPISISNENCRRLLNGTGGKGEEGEMVENLQQMVKPTAYRQCTLELALTLNSTPANPICIVQFYGQTEENLGTINNTILQLRRIGGEMLAFLGENKLPNRECQQNKIEILRAFLNSTVLAVPKNGKYENAWLEAFRKFIQQNVSMRLLTDFLTSRMALITFYYRGSTFQHIIYRDDYTFWELMSDVGGVLGLYFGLTIVTVYELAVFFTVVEGEPAEAHRPPPEQLFTRRFIYRRDHSMSTDQPVPPIF